MERQFDEERVVIRRRNIACPVRLRPKLIRLERMVLLCEGERLELADVRAAEAMESAVRLVTAEATGE